MITGDICDEEIVSRLLESDKPRAVLHFAAESNVGRSIHGPRHVAAANANGAFALPQAARGYWPGLKGKEKAASVSCTR